MEAHLAANEGIHLYVIGVGMYIDLLKLQALSSFPIIVGSTVFLSRDFGQLPSITYWLLRSMCLHDVEPLSSSNQGANLLPPFSTACGLVSPTLTTQPHSLDISYLDQLLVQHNATGWHKVYEYILARTSGTPRQHLCPITL